MAQSWQQPLAEIYRQLSDAELRVRIAVAREQLGGRLLILGHHYQQDAVIDFADFTGDSFELSRKAAAQKGIDYVVFCGVHFMAESADVLTDEHVKVILPDLGAGCSMADMASIDQAIECWEQLQAACPEQLIVPITYVNSSAAIKAFVGEHGGAVCTSSNCRQVLEWALRGGAAAEGSGFGVPFGSEPQGRGQGSGTGLRQERQDAKSATPDTAQPASKRSAEADSTGAGQDRVRGADPTRPPGALPSPARRVKVLFLPDQHLGRNTAFAMGYPLDNMVVWDPRQDMGGNSPAALAEADFVLWKGHCSVHQLFRPEHVDQVRREFPDMKVIVHPECRWEVVQKADLSGSTASIVRTIDAAPPGSQWAVGTEVHLVNRLCQQHPEQHIIVLSGCQCLCTTMYRIDLPHLCWVLENLSQGKVVNQISVDAHTRHWATVALQRMLAITAASRPTGAVALQWAAQRDESD